MKTCKLEKRVEPMYKWHVLKMVHFFMNTYIFAFWYFLIKLVLRFKIILLYGIEINLVFQVSPFSSQILNRWKQSFILTPWHITWLDTELVISYKSIAVNKSCVVYNSNKNYDELLRDNNEGSIHPSHLRALISEVFQFLNNMNP